MTKSKFRFFAILFGFLVLAGSAFNLYRLWNQPPDASWAPKFAAQDLKTVSDRAEVLLHGQPIQKALSEGTVMVAGPYHPIPLTQADLTVRINNYHQDRVARVPQALTSAAALGGAFVLLLLGLLAPTLGGSLSREERGITELHLLHES